MLDVVQVRDSLGNGGTANLVVTEGLSVSPEVASAVPREVKAFVASGGSGNSYSWSFLYNSSGASIDSHTGEYTAGKSPGLPDVVQVRDPLGNVAFVRIEVGPSVDGQSSGCQSSREAWSRCSPPAGLLHVLLGEATEEEEEVYS